VRTRHSLISAFVVLALAGLLTSAAAAEVPRWKAWLCNPSVGRDWCHVGLSITIVDATGHGTVDLITAPKTRPIDCFYVYPTISEQQRGNSDLRIEGPQKLAAVGHAAQFGRVCRVFAPVYRQVTGYGYGSVPPGDSNLAYRDVRAAWRDYLAHDNHGRGVVLIGHSQGAHRLTRLLREEIEPSAPVRRLLVSAILLGGNVTVASGSDRGGDFKSVPACRKTTQTGCVVAYASWGRTPPSDAAFVSAGPGRRVLCVNPAALAGGTAPITPVFPWFNSNGLLTGVPMRQAQTIYMAFPGLYTARCVQRGSRAWLLVERVTSITVDPRPTVQEVLNPSWGLHAADVSVALGTLVALVRAQGKAWTAHR
jgi:pimeloyl-ACP methyl ester carboxylesterase